jgi:hypothetical protein
VQASADQLKNHSMHISLSLKPVEILASRRMQPEAVRFSEARETDGVLRAYRFTNC